MFTGLIQGIGEVISIEASPTGGHLSIDCPEADRAIEIGESMAIQGACLTVTRIEKEVMHFDLLGETIRCTTLGQLEVGQRVNLERALRVGDAMGGHMVSGHVTCTGEVDELLTIDRDHILWIRCASERMAEVEVKGSIAVDGVSLTVVDVEEERFSVHIIPHTWAHSTLPFLAVGRRVNIE